MIALALPLASGDAAGQTITTSLNSLERLVSRSGNASASQSFTVDASGLNEPLLVTAPSGFQVSTDNSSFSKSITISPSGGNVTSRTVYVRIGADAPLGTVSGNIALSSGSTYVTRTTVHGLGSNFVNGVFASGNAVYVATSPGVNGGLGVSTDGGATFTNRNTANSNLPNNYVNDVHGVGSTIFVATNGGLCISTDGGTSFTTRTTTNGLGSNFVRGVFAVGSSVYAATDGGLSISTDNGNTFTNRNTTSGLTSTAVVDAYANGSTVYAAMSSFSPPGGVGISTNGGVNFTTRTTANGLGSSNVWDVFVADNTIYAGTGGGLSISTNGGTSFTNRTTADGLGHNNVNGVHVVGSTVYAATSGGLSISTDGGATFTNRTTADGLGSNGLSSVFVDENSVYASTLGSGLTIISPGGPSAINQSLAVSGQVQSVMKLPGFSGNNTISTDYTMSDGYAIGLELYADYLAVGGGGSGGTAGDTSGTGGGGGGGVLTGSSLAFPVGNYPVVVGAGGVAPATSGSSSVQGVNGSNSTFVGVTALAGGGGGRFNTSGNSGSSGGGGGGGASAPGGAGTTGQGFAGGAGRAGSTAGTAAGGGGGGAGAVGGNASNNNGGSGGSGIVSTITGSEITYGGGGGGGGLSAGGAGGLGGGGAGGTGSSGAGSGTAARGGGGGGAGTFVKGGNGGSGVVIVRYPGAPLATGGTITEGSGSATGYTLHTFSSPGNFTFGLTQENLQSLKAILTGNITGSGGLSFDGPGTLVLAGTNTFTGTTLISSGTVQLGNGGTTGSVPGPIVNHSVLVINRSDDFTLSNEISGAGSVVKLGGNTLTVASSVEGPVSVDAGTLLVTGSTGAVTVNSGGTLAGTGATGSVTLGPGASLSPGSDGIGTLTTGSLSLAGGTAWNWQTSSINGTVGEDSDLVESTGALTISATAGNPVSFNISALGDFSLTGVKQASWTVGRFPGGITGFSADAFTIDTNGLVIPALGGFTLALGEDNTLVLLYQTLIPTDGTPDEAYHSAHGSMLAGPSWLYVNDSAVDASGRWFGIGTFTGYGSISAAGLLCLKPDGTPDAEFHSNLGSGLSHPGFLSPSIVMIRQNGKILVSGQFDSINGVPIRKSIVSINPDGTLDTNFNVKLNALTYQFGYGALAEQADGKILGSYLNKVLRLNADGTPDTSFNSPTFIGAIWVIAVQADGKILVGGYEGLKRLNSDGSADTAFNTALGANFNRDSGNNSVNAIRIEPGGRIWVGGVFTTFNNQPLRGLACLNPDGTLDSSKTAACATAFTGNAPPRVIDIHLQRDGKVVVCGVMPNFNNAWTSAGLRRLNADGTPDTEFSARLGSGFSGIPQTLAFRPTGELIVGGNFTSVSGQPARGIAQLAWGGSLLPESQTLSATYGSAIQETEAFAASGLSGTVSYSIRPSLPPGLSLDSASGVVSGTPLTTLPTASAFTITATGSAGGTASSTLTLSVAKAPLTVTANDATRARGQSNPAFTASITGLIGGDTLSAISGAPSFSCEATTNSPPGSYAVTPSIGTLAAVNYSFQSFIAGSLTVGKTAQIINIAPLATSVPLKDLNSVSLTASSSAGLPVTLSLEPGSAATLTGSIGAYSLSDIGQTGTVTVRASQAGDADHEAAQDALVSFDVTKSNQTLTFEAPADKTFGDPPFDLIASANSDLPVAFTLISGPAELNGSSVTLTGAGKVVVRASQAGNELYNEASVTRSFTVGRSAQTITFGTLDAVTYGDAPVALAAISDSGLAVTYDIVSGPAAIIAGTVAHHAVGTVVVRANQAGDDNHLAAEPVERTLIVNSKALTVTGAIALDKVADESTAARIVGAELAGVITGDEVFLFNSEAGTFPQSNPGTNLAVATAMTVDGPDAGNYTLIQPLLTASILEDEPARTHQELWRLANFGSYLSQASGADNADPDRDGISNLMEYALDLNPNAPGVMPAALVMNGGQIEYTYNRSSAAREAGLLYQIEWSDTLEPGSWSTENVTEQIQGVEGALEAVKATIPAGTSGRRFLRLRVNAADG